MKEAAISLVVQKLGDLLIQKLKLIKGVEGQVAWLKDELQRMQSFLKEASEREPNDERIRKWISEVTQLAQHAEDVIDTFALKFDASRNRGLFRRCASFPKKVYCLHRMGQHIKSIQQKLKDIDISRARFGIPCLDEAGRVVSPTTSSDNQARSDATTCKQFVSLEFSLKEMMKEVVLQLLEHDEDRLKVLEILEKLPEEAMKRKVYDHLQERRDLMAMDGRQQDWDYLATAGVFPIDEGSIPPAIPMGEFVESPPFNASLSSPEIVARFGEVSCHASASNSRKRHLLDTIPTKVKKNKKSIIADHSPPKVSEDKLQMYFKNLSSASSTISSNFPLTSHLDIIKAQLAKPFPIDSNSFTNLQNSLALLSDCNDTAQIPPSACGIFQQMLMTVDNVDILLHSYLESVNSNRAQLKRLANLQGQKMSLVQELNSVEEKDQAASVEHHRLVNHEAKLHAKLAHLYVELSDTQAKRMALMNDMDGNKEAKNALYSHMTCLDLELEPLLQQRNTIERRVSLSEKGLVDLDTVWSRVRELVSEAEANFSDVATGAVDPT